MRLNPTFSRLGRSCRSRGFTLIELLIVVAIISILAAIAVPNFLEAQTRAKVARIQSDMRTMVTALESYRVDNNNYPPRFGGRTVNYATDVSDRNAAQGYYPAISTRFSDSFGNPSLTLLTTPIGYISTLFPDVFFSAPYSSGPTTTDLDDRYRIIDYVDPPMTSVFISLGRQAIFAFPALDPNEIDAGYMTISVGPDGHYGFINDRYRNEYPSEPAEYQRTMCRVYDPTNGTISAGNILRFSAEDPSVCERAL